MNLSINENISEQEKDVICVENIIYEKNENMEWNNVYNKNDKEIDVDGEISLLFILNLTSEIV